MNEQYRERAHGWYLGLLNEAREFSERIIDKIYSGTGLGKKLRAYREQAHKAYLALVKQRRPAGEVRRRGSCNSFSTCVVTWAISNGCWIASRKGRSLPCPGGC